MLGNTLLFQPLAEAADSNAGSFPDSGIAIVQTSLDDRPNLSQQWGHVLTATLDGNPEGQDGTTA